MSERKRFKWLRWLLTIVVLMVMGDLVIAAGILWVATRRPHPLMASELVPEVDWTKLESVRLKTSDGEELGAWFSEGLPGKPVVILMHGYRADRSTVLGRAEMMSSFGCSVLMVSARAHGDSTGDFTDIGWGARLDFEAAMEWVNAWLSERPVILYGVSMGAVAAIYAASEFEFPLAGMILECPYQHLIDSAMWHRAERYFPPGVSHLLFAGGRITAPYVLGEAARQSPLKAMEQITPEFPILILAGEQDKRAPVEDAQALASCAHSKACVVVIADADHDDVFHKGAKNYRSAIEAFMEQVEK